MKLTAELVLGFQNAFLREQYDDPKPTPQFHIDLWRLCCSDHLRVAIAAPRGHAKSTAVTMCFGLAALLFKWKRHLVIVSETEEQASLFLKNMTNELENNQALREAFDIRGFEVANSTEVICKMGEKHKFRIIAKGSNQRLRGMNWNNIRPDLIIGDDLENDEIVMNADRRFKFKQWFLNALLPAMSSSGHIRVVGTILHMDSLLENFMPIRDPIHPEYPVISTDIADYTENPHVMWKSVRYRAAARDFEANENAAILWPEQFSRERLIQIKQEYVQLGMPDGFAQEYLNYPIDESLAFIRKLDLIAMEPEDFDKPMTKYASVDFALSKDAKADYTVIVIVGVDPDGMAHLIDLRRGRWDTLEIVDEMIAVQKAHNPVVWFPEKGTVWLAVEASLLNEMYKPGRAAINYDPVSPAKDKMVKARPLQHRIRAHALRFNKDAVWYDQLELELLRFPRGAHDDQVDALAHLCYKIAMLASSPTVAQIADREFERAKRRTLTMRTGRSRITGY